MTKAFFETHVPTVYQYMDTGSRSGPGLTLAELQGMGVPTAGGAVLTTVDGLLLDAQVVVRDPKIINE